MLEERIYWDEINDHQILILDFRNLSRKEIFQLIDTGIEYYNQHKLTNVLSLTDLSNVAIDAPILKKFTEMDEITGKFDKKSAVVGLNRAKTLFLKLVNFTNKNNVRGFYSKKDAVEWLIE